MRFGKKGHPSYRIVALDKRKKRDGAYLEKVGIYNPMSNPAQIQINDEKLQYWLSKGAQLSEGIRKLLISRKKGVKS